MARLLLFGGKGGVGKTTTSTATAIHLADCMKVLLVSVTLLTTSDSLNVEIGTEPTPVPGVEGLYGLEMDPSQVARLAATKVG